MVLKQRHVIMNLSNLFVFYCCDLLFPLSCMQGPLKERPQKGVKYTFNILPFIINKEKKTAQDFVVSQGTLPEILDAALNATTSLAAKRNVTLAECGDLKVNLKVILLC